MACGKLTLDSRSIVKLKTVSALRDLAKDPTKVEEFVDNLLKSINKNNQYELNSAEEFDVLNNIITEVVSNTGKLNPTAKEQINANLSGILSKRMGLEIKTTEIPEPTIESPNHEEDSNIKLTTVDLDDFYGSAFIVKEYMLNNFQSKLLTHCLINFEKAYIISNNKDLNNEIQAMKRDYFFILQNFLGIPTKELFINGKIDNIAFARVMELAKQEFAKLDRDNITYAFNNIHVVNREGIKYNESLINAFNAYAVLSNFDNLVEKILRGIISVNKVGNDSVYSLTIKNALSKNWTTTEETDAMKELGKFSRLLVETCPLIDRDTHTKLGYVNMSSFLGVTSKLRNESILSKLRGNNELYDMFIEFHTAPSYYLPKIIEAILANKLNDYITFSRTDLNVLTSIYERFYNKNGKSLYNVMRNAYQEVRTSFDILESIAEIVDRSCGNYYIQYVRSEDGIKIKEVTRINKDRESIRKQNAINIYNQYRTDKESVVEKYKITESKGGTITAKIPLDNGETLTVSVKNNDVTIPDDMKTFMPDFKKLIDRYDIGNSVLFDEQELKYIKILEFIDSFLDTRFLTGNIQVLNKLVDNEIDYLRSSNLNVGLHLNGLIQAALTAGNALKLQVEYNKLENVDLQTYLRNNSKYYNNKLKNKVHGYLDGKTILTVDATTNNKLEALINAEQELLGTPYKTTSKNLEGNNIPLNGISNLASYFTYFVNKVIDSDTYRNTAFGEEGIAALNGVIAKNGGENRHGTTKSISQFSVAELAYTSIIYDYFHNRFGKNPEVLIQPTTYSDKSKIFLFKVLLNHLKNKDGVSFKDMSIPELKQFKRDTIKSFYKAVENRILLNYKVVFGSMINSDAFAEILNRPGILEELKTKPINDYTMDDFANILSVVEYWEYADLSWAAGVDNVENVHVCKNKKNNFLKPNNDLRYKAEILYNDDNVFNIRDQKERKDFLVDLINNNVVFPIKLKGKQDNEDLKYILSSGQLNVDIISEPSKGGWNDKNTQNLILAKDEKGNPIKSVDDITDNFELNPMLERYFYEYSTLAENIRLLLTGSEIAHPFKSNSDYPITDASFDQFIEEESTRAKAQLKRNVIVPATLLHFAQNSFMGIPSEYRIAVMEDFPANVYTFKGDSTSIDSMDGSAIVHPVMAILENYSLQDNAVGLNKKPIGHGINSIYGNAQLLKFATFGMDNEWIRKSNLSTIKFKQLLSRMNLNWEEDIDLTKNIYGKSINVTDMTNGERLYFNQLGKHYEVGEIKKVEGKVNTYNINYYEVNERGNRVDIEGTPVMIHKQDVVINNLTSLWEALGGEYSETLNNNELTFSNASWFAVANYVNWVGEFKGEIGELPNQHNTYQPLKKTMIAYLCNKSAIKVGATNINRKTSWTDNSPLRYFYMDTDGLGVQMDADHHADEAEMTEFTQVISSLEANGYLHDISKLTYEDLGKATLSIIKDEVKAVELYLKTYNKSDMYELIGRDLIKNIRSSDNKVGLSQSIIDIIREEFKKVQKSHVNDEFKIPFSDSNIQAISLSTFTSRLNSTAVKKKHPGSGMVMVPGFGTIQNFWLNGECYSYDDIYRMASSQGKTPEEFLMEEQAKIESQSALPINQLLPGDKIVVFNENGERQELNIDTIEEYRRVKRMYSEFFPDVTKGQDLKPAQVYWEAGGEKFNLFDMPAVIRAIQLRAVGNIDKATDLELQKNIQNTFLLLDKGFMPLTEDMEVLLNENPEEFKSEFGDISYLNGIQVVEIRNLVNKPAELIVSKLYATKFHLGANDTIASIKEEGINYFIKKYDKSHILATNQYDIAFTKGDGNHTYILINDDPVNGIKIEDNDNVKRVGNTVWRTDDKGHKLYKLSENGVTLVEEFDVAGTKVLKTNKPGIINQIWKSNNYDTLVYGEPKSEASITDVITKFLKEGEQDNYLSKIAGFSRDKLEEFNNRRKSSLCRKQYVSFLKSLEFTASRIPAQTLQSFMKMEVKQFMSTDKNIAIVTPFQAYLQGSDYDIDKVYLMGYDFDDNGIYLNWSPLFNYSSLETLHDSERLPTPSGKNVKYSRDGIDITQELVNYSLNPSTKNIVDLIIRVGDNELVSYNNKVISDEKIAKRALYLINKHTTHKIPASLSDKIYKNATSSRIAQIIVDLKNMMAAYTPINMDEPHEAASNSSLGKQEKRITMDNPASTFVMQVQNMAGKQVIGIAAVAEKIFFAASYYFNEGARSKNSDWINNMMFYRRFKLSGTDYQTRNLIANINLNEEQREYFSSLIKTMVEKDVGQAEAALMIQQDLGFTADQSLAISALLSAATDNAKELILSKINAGPNLAGVYLHLIMMGIDFSDIANFMTSPAVQLIADLTKTNIYDDYSESNTVDTVLKELMEGPSINKYTTTKEIQEALGDLFKLDEKTSIGQALSEQFKIRKKLAYVTNYEVNRYIERFNYLIDKLSSDKIDYTKITEFYNIYNLAKETTLFGRMLSVNQGFRTDIAGKLKFVDMLESGVALREKNYSINDKNFINDVITDKPYLKGRESEIAKILSEAKGLGIADGKFSIDKFFSNEKYKAITIKYYNLIKGTWNLYDIISRVPHFKALYDVYRVINTFDTSMSNRFNIIYNLKRSLGINLSESQYRSLSNYIDEFLIIKWLESKNFSFVVKEGEFYFNKGDLTEAKSDVTLFLNSDDGRASFKWWMENVVINNIKNGILDGSSKTFGLARNKFIASIRPGKTENIFNKYTQTFYYLPINMNSRKSPLDEKIFNTYVNEFSKLYKYTYQNYPLTDLFVLYNLIVNKNRYGEDKLTGIFEGFLKDDTKDSVIRDLFKYIGESDYNLSNTNLDLNQEDILMKIAPVVSSNNEWVSNHKYIRQYDTNTKKYILKRKERNGYIRVDSPSEDVDTYYNYYTLTSPEYDQKIGKMLISKEVMTPESLYESLKLLISRNSIKLNIHCS